MTIPALDHDWRLFREESYWDGSYRWYYCTRCGEKDDDTVYDDDTFYPN